MHSSTCNNAVYKAVGAGRTDRNCSSALAWWTIVFSFFELFLSQLKDFHSLWCVLALQLNMHAKIACILPTSAVVYSHLTSKRCEITKLINMLSEAAEGR